MEYAFDAHRVFVVVRGTDDGERWIEERGRRRDVDGRNRGGARRRVRRGLDQGENVEVGTAKVLVENRGDGVVVRERVVSDDSGTEAGELGADDSTDCESRSADARGVVVDELIRRDGVYDSVL